MRPFDISHHFKQLSKIHLHCDFNYLLNYNFIMKQLKNKLQLTLVILISGLGYIVSCTHDNSFPPPPVNNNPVITHGTNVHVPGNMTTGNVMNGKWINHTPAFSGLPIMLAPRVY